PLWRRFLFTWKVTCRNLLRYKRRFWMTVIGVAGCTSLLVAGFGISDSLNAIITRQFSAVSHYDLMTVVTKEEALESGTVYDYLTEGNPITESLTVSMETTRQSPPEGGVDVYLMVPQDVQRFANFLDLHERVSGKAVPLGEEGVVLTEKLAKTLGVQAGDTITLTNGDEQTGTFTVSGVCEHYISNYVYMSAATYEAGFGTPVSYNAALSKLTDDNQEVRDAVSETLLAMDNVASLTFTQDSIVQVLNMLNSIDAVVVLIIVCAASLAFVVLYNLSNINIAERVKEIATIKVLGFYDREVNAYVNRESVALTLIGTLFGVFGGIALHRFIIVTVEVDAVMFGRDIQPLSFVYAIALTLLFSTLVNLVMQRSLRRISMVESMKAPE
ncbi:ABC transporter permease, partial [uncultured Subdoligranulum sp.]|uniref:ABC transporter permease n=1 Tax=uncultured Subdoligranulum sp. TaxID=512298 RepID=UPI00263873DA